MSRIYIHPLPRAKYSRNGYASIEEFYEKHPVFTRGNGKVVIVPSPIEGQEDLEKVIAKLREVANG